MARFSEQELRREYHYLSNGGSINNSLKNKEGVNALINQFIADVEKATGIKYMQDLQKKETVANVEVKKEVVNKQRKYNNALEDEVYRKIDDMIIKGYTNSEISRSCNVHRNTVSKRRSSIRK